MKSSPVLALIPSAVFEPFFLPVIVLAMALVLYLLANSFVRNLIEKIRASIREAGVPFELLLGPFRLLFLIIAVTALSFYLPVSDQLRGILKHALSIAAMIGSAWLMLRLFVVLEQFVLLRYRPGAKGEVQSRRMATHLSLIRKILNVVIIVLAVSGVLMTFDTVRQIGLSILASAGIAGVVMGFAAQRSLQTLIAGIQIAIAQPIRIDDVVIVENEWGRIEEITLTYVVVQLVDQRRLIVPITWFIDKPFQNWTRSSSELAGTVSLAVDFSVPPDAVRHELERIVAATPLWDGRLVRLQVAGTAGKTMELRALVSAENSVELWDLQCLVRERLIGFLGSNFTEGGAVAAAAQPAGQHKAAVS